MLHIPVEFLPIVLAGFASLGYLIVGSVRIVAERPRRKRLAEYRKSLQQFEGVWELQEATDRNHEVALLQKILFQTVGLVLIVLPPSTIIVGTFTESSFGGPTSPTLFSEFVSIALVMLAVLLVKKPTQAWTRMRMRTEVMRLHAHICLAGLPPYDRDEPAATAKIVISRVGEADTSVLRNHIGQMIDSLERCVDAPLNQAVDAIRASAYDRERIQEQIKYFEKTVGIVRRLLGFSGYIFKGSLVIAFLGSLVRWLAAESSGVFWIEDISRITVRVCVGVVTLVLTARAVIGWESRLSAYKPMREELEGWRAARQQLTGGSWGNTDDPIWQCGFRNLSLAIEIAMAKEVLRWLVAVERELYEAPI